MGLAVGVVAAGIVAASVGFDIVVVLAARALAAFVDEERRQVHVAFLVRRVVELDQRELEFLVAGIAAFLATLGPERLVDAVGEARHDVEELPLARRVEVRDRGFDQVARAVQLVLALDVPPSLFRLDEEEVRVEVAVLGLHGSQVVDDRVQALLPRRIGVRRQRIRDRFHPLGDIGIPEDMRLVVVAFLPRELCQPACALVMLVVDLERHVAVGVHPRTPEHIVQRDIGKRYGSHRLSHVCPSSLYSGERRGLSPC